MFPGLGYQNVDSLPRDTADGRPRLPVIPLFGPGWHEAIYSPADPRPLASCPLVLSLILAESSIELVPNELANHPAIVTWAHRKRKDPRRLILDQTHHHAAILRLGRSGAGRGRPDIAHFCLLLALGSPLNLMGQLRCFVHTRDDRTITVSPRARLPRNTERFMSLLEQLYEQSVVPAVGPPLLSLDKGNISKIIKEQNGDVVVALTTHGTPRPMPEVALKLSEHKRPVLLIGAFPEGHFSKTTMELANESYRIDRRRLEAWTVVARAIYDYELAISTNTTK